MKLRTTITLTFLGLLAVSIASADMSPQQKLMARRAAEADAYRKLAARILGMQVSSQTTVRDFATESDQIRSSLDHFIKGIRIPDEAVVYYEDGSCEVTAEVTLEKVVTTLKNIRDEVYDGSRWTDESFDEMTRNYEKKVISEVGAGAALPDTEMPDPATLEYLQLHNARGKAIQLPAIYRQFGARARLMAKRAAEMDAYRKLIERIYGLRIDSETTVRDLVEVDDEIRLSTMAALKGVRTGAVCYQADGVVQVQMSVTLEQVTTVLRKVIDEKTAGGRFTSKTEESLRKEINRKVISVVGEGALDTRRRGRTTEPITGTGVDHRRTVVERVIESTTVIVLD